MFKLIRPCTNCPFRKGQGELFKLRAGRALKILEGQAFQCHKTVDYEHEHDSRLRQGSHPQQCAGVMAVLHREGRPNTIMQIAERLGEFDPSKLDPDNEAYGSIEEVLKAHG